VASPLDASTTIDEEAAAAREANRLDRPGLTIFTDGSRLENGATGYAVTWKKGISWKGHKTHMGWGQEAFDAECATLAMALQVAAARSHTTGAVTIFTDAQAAIWGMASDDPGPGQKYALEARRHIAALRAKEPNGRVEIRWCPNHQGIEGNEVADKWAKLAADEPDAHGVEWFSTTNLDGSASEREFPLPRSLANVKRGFSERNRADAKGWARVQLARTRNRKYRRSEKQKPDPTVTKTTKRLASRFCLRTSITDAPNTPLVSDPLASSCFENNRLSRLCSRWCFISMGDSIIACSKAFARGVIHFQV